MDPFVDYPDIYSTLGHNPDPTSGSGFDYKKFHIRIKTVFVITLVNTY